MILGIFWVAPAFGQVSDQYELRFDGFSKLKPTQICSVIDLVIVMQGTHAKIGSGKAPSEQVMFEGVVPPEGLNKPTVKKSPKHVYQTMAKALDLFFKNEGIKAKIPQTPDRVYPGDVFVVTTLAFDSLFDFLQEKGVVKVGDRSLLRYRYPDRLSPSDCFARASTVLTNWENIYQN